MPSVNLGRVSIVPKGEWSNSASYEKLDVVTYGGGSYIANKEVPAGTSLSTTEYWQLLLTPLSLGTVETVSASTGASAEIVTTSTEQILNLSIPRGVAGNESIDDTKGAGDTDYVWSADKLWNEVNNLDIDINGKANAIKKTVSGDIVSFDDGVDNQYVKNLKVNIEPIQDLHGYDSPWPAGSGTNIWDEETELGSLDTTTGEEITVSYIIRSKNYTPVTAGNVYHVVTQSGAGSGIWMLFYDSNKQVVTSGLPSGASSANNARRYNNGYKITIPSETTIAYIRFYFRSDYGTTYKHDTAINYPSTVTTYSPYSNICPISGLTEAKVTRTGINIWDEQWDIGYLNMNNGNFQSTPQYVRSKNKFYIKGGESYRITCTRSGTLGNFGFCFYDANGGFISAGTCPANSTFTAPDGSEQMAFFVPSSWYTGDYANDISINYPATDTQYHASHVQTATIDLDGTRYGGTLNLTGGKMLVTMGLADMGDLTYTLQGSGYAGSTFLMYVTTKQLGAGNFISSQYKTDPTAPLESIPNGSMRGRANTYSIYVRDDRYSDATDFKTAVTGQQLVYELLQPFEVQLTPTQITTLLNKNNIWADTGNIINLDYAVDTESYIQKNVVITKAPVITENASGSIVSINDGAEDMPLESLNVNVEPVQDLHGYDSPWPAGGGKNLLDPDKLDFTSNTQKKWYSTTGLTLNGGTTYTFSVSGTGADNTFVYFYKYSDNTQLAYYKTEISYTPVNDEIVYFLAYKSDGLPAQNYQLEIGSSATSYAPYENICPISGWTQANVTRTGVNLIGFSGRTAYSGSGFYPTDTIDLSTPKYYVGISGSGYCLPNKAPSNVVIGDNNTVSFTINSAYYGVGFNFPVKPSTVYKQSYTLGQDTATQIAFYTNESKFINYANIGVSTPFFTTPSDAYYAILVVTGAGGSAPSASNVQIEVGSTATPYQPYQGQHITIPLGQTVYGAQVDVLAGTMTVDTAFFTLTGNTSVWQSPTLWYSQDAGRNSLGAYWYFTYTGFSSLPKPKNYGSYTYEKKHIKCNMLKFTDSGVYGNDNPYTYAIATDGTYLAIRIPKSVLSDVSTEANARASVMSWIDAHNLTFAYEIATPVVITGLTPAIMRTLLGTNNIWADCGAVDVKYRSDTKLFIENAVKETNATTRKMIADTANGNLAPKSLDSGDLIIVGDELRKCTASIGIGNTITDSNSTVATLADVIKALQ